MNDKQKKIIKKILFYILILLFVFVGLFLFPFIQNKGVVYAYPDTPSGVLLDDFFVSMTSNAITEYNIYDRDDNLLFEMDIIEYEVSYSFPSWVGLDTSSDYFVLYNSDKTSTHTLAQGYQNIIVSDIRRSNTSVRYPWGVAMNNGTSNIRYGANDSFVITANFTGSLTLILRTNLVLTEQRVRGIMPQYISRDSYLSFNEWLLDNFSDYDFNYQQAFNDGYREGIDEGYNIAFDEGYIIGYEEGKIFGENITDRPLDVLFSAAFNGIGSILNIEVLPNLRLGSILLFPLIIGMVAFITSSGKKS